LARAEKGERLPTEYGKRGETRAKARGGKRKGGPVPGENRKRIVQLARRPFVRAAEKKRTDKERMSVLAREQGEEG